MRAMRCPVRLSGEGFHEIRSLIVPRIPPQCLIMSGFLCPSDRISAVRPPFFLMSAT